MSATPNTASEAEKPTAVIQSRYRMYRCGSYGYAYNPNVKLWEVYEFDGESGAVVDLLGHENSRRQAHDEAIRRDDRKRQATRTPRNVLPTSIHPEALEQERDIVLTEVGRIRDLARTLCSEIDAGKEPDGRSPSLYREDRGRRLTLKLAREKLHHVTAALGELTTKLAKPPALEPLPDGSAGRGIYVRAN